MKLNKILSILLLMTLMIGCNNNNNIKNDEQINITNIEAGGIPSQRVSNEAEKEILKSKGVSQVRAVNTNHTLIVALKVDTFQGFNTKQIEKKVKKKLKRYYPNYKVLTSTDKKVYMEIEKLEGKLTNNDLKHKDFKKQIKQIKKLRGSTPS